MKLHILLAAVATVSMTAAASAVDLSEFKTVASLLPKQENVATVGSSILIFTTYYPMQGAVPAGLLKAGKKEFPDEYPLVVVPSSKGFKACIVYEGSITDRCAIDEDRDGKFDRVDGKQLDAPVAYEERELPDPRHAIDQVSYIYAGATSDTLHLKYRTATKGVYVRSSTEEMSVPLSKSFPQGVAFRNIKMTILSIDGMGIRYRIEP